MTADLIRVLVAADHNLIRRGLEMMLASFDDMVMVGEAKKGGEVLEFCKQNQVDVILMDLFIEEDDCVTTISAIHKRHSGIQVIILVNFDEYALVRQAVAAGAAGILIKDTENNQLAATIWQVHKAQQLLSLELLDDYIHTLQPQPKQAGELGHDLTEREIKILSLISRGATNAQIAKELLVSRATVKTHVSSILSKLGVATRTEAAALAIQLRLVSVPILLDELTARLSGLPAEFRERISPEVERLRISTDAEKKNGEGSPALRAGELESLLAPASRLKELLEAQSAIDPGGQALVSGDERVFIYANPAYRALTPHPEIDPTGLPYEQVWPAEEGLAQWEIIRGALEGGGEAHIPARALRLADETIHFFTFHVYRMAWQGRPAAYLVWWDVSEVCSLNGMEGVILRAAPAK